MLQAETKASHLTNSCLLKRSDLAECSLLRILCAWGSSSSTNGAHKTLHLLLCS